MAQVTLTQALSDRFTSGETSLTVTASNVRELLRTLDADFPGLGKEIEQAQILAIDGEMFREPFMQTIKPDSEVYVLPKIAAG